MAVCSSKVIPVKSGSDAVFAMTYKDEAGTPISIIDYDIYVDFYDPKTGVLLKRTSVGDGITINELPGQTPTVGTYTVNAGNTIDWSLGEMPVDILYGSGGMVQHTEDFILDMIKGHTQKPIIDSIAS